MKHHRPGLDCHGVVNTLALWAKRLYGRTVVVGTLFAGLLAALAAAYTRRRMAAWRARLNAYPPDYLTA